MFRFVILSALVAIAAAGVIDYHHDVIATPGVALKQYVDHETEIIEKPTINHVGTVVKSFPSAHSYQSQTRYHSKQVVEPIYAHGVEKKIISTPIEKQVVEQVAVPVVKTYAAPVVKAYAAPIVKQVVAAPAVHYTAPVVKQVVAAPAHISYAAPAQYAYAAPAQYAYAAPSQYAYASYAPYAQAYKAW